MLRVAGILAEPLGLRHPILGASTNLLGRTGVLVGRLPKFRCLDLSTTRFGVSLGCARLAIGRRDAVTLGLATQLLRPLALLSTFSSRPRAREHDSDDQHDHEKDRADDDEDDLVLVHDSNARTPRLDERGR
jgi:hypothetical protein